MAYRQYIPFFSYDKEVIVMKKLWTLVLVALMLIVSVAPVAASGRPTGEPPGWSQENSGNGGSAGPGNG
jgi:hypothetical protein